jgi:SPOR domain
MRAAYPPRQHGGNTWRAGVTTLARMTRAALLVLALLLVPAAPAAAELPLGARSLHETRTTQMLAPGVTYTKIVRGKLSRKDAWTVDVAVLAARADARALAERLRAAGFGAAVESLERAPDDRRRGPLAYRVHSGRFATKAEADVRAAELRAAGFTVRGSVFSAEDGERSSGPWVVHVLEVDRRAYGRVAPALANDVVAGRETLSALAARKGALAGINGGYFVIGDADGTPGDLAGSSILGGRVVSEAVDGRTDLLLGPASRRSAPCGTRSRCAPPTVRPGCSTATIASPASSARAVAPAATRRPSARSTTSAAPIRAS